MKPENLEILLIDRALGELAPEVDELLGSYLARDPEAACQSGLLDATVRQARRAAVPPPARVLPTLDTGRLRPALRAQRRRERAGTWVRLAACVVLGLVLGWVGHGERGSTSVAGAPTPAVVPVREPPETSAGQFWSLARLEAGRERRQPAAADSGDRYRLRWESPVKMPSVEDNQ
jgi:hypothetical protein